MISWNLCKSSVLVGLCWQEEMVINSLLSNGIIQVLHSVSIDSLEVNSLLSNGKFQILFLITIHYLQSKKCLVLFAGVGHVVLQMAYTGKILLLLENKILIIHYAFWYHSNGEDEGYVIRIKQRWRSRLPIRLYSWG